MLEIDTIWQKYNRMAKERMKICIECDRFDATLSQCRECGCFMKAKAKMPSAVCPINKWGRYKDGENNGVHI